MHLGLIGGIGPAATEYYYRGLVKAHAAAGKPLDLTIVNAETSDLLTNLSAGAADTQCEIFLRLIQRLKAAGAEAAAVTSLAGHFCIRELKAVSPLPIIDAIPVLDTDFASRGLSRVGLLGTRAVMESGLYGGISSVDVIAPAGDELDATHATYVAIASSGAATDEQRRFLLQAGKRLIEDQGADAVVLAGTDLFVAFAGHDCGFPVIDAAQVHINELARLSLAPTGNS